MLCMNIRPHILKALKRGVWDGSEVRSTCYSRALQVCFSSSILGLLQLPRKPVQRIPCPLQVFTLSCTHTDIPTPTHIYIKSKRLNLKLKSKFYPVHPSLISWMHLEKRNYLSSLFSMNANTHCYKPKRSTSLTRWAMMLSLCSEGCRLNNTTSPSIKCLSTMSPNLSSWAIFSRFPYFRNLSKQDTHIRSLN